MIALDVREAWKPRHTGKGQWTAGLLRALLQKNIPLTLFSIDPPPAEWVPLLRPDHTIILFQDRGFRWHWRVHKHLLKMPGSIFIATTSFLLPALSTSGVRFVTVVHDLIAFQNEPHDRKAQWIERLTLGRALRRSWKILTVSESTKSDLIKRYPSLDSQKILSVFAGPGALIPARKDDGKTIFCFATLCPRKNQRRLIEAYAQLPQDVQSRTRLMLAGGRGWQDDNIVALAKQTPGVEWLGYITDERAKELFSTCTVFAYPSLYEGFGLPVLDALAAGIPVLTSSGGGLREVAGDAALIVDPLSVTSLRDGLQQLLTNRELREDLEKKGPRQASKFSWLRTADLLLQHLEIDNIA